MLVVALVREHYGFDDEDPSELARIKLLKAEQAKRKNQLICLLNSPLNLLII